MSLGAQVTNAFPTHSAPEFMAIRGSFERIRSLVLAVGRWIQSQSKSMMTRQASKRMRVTEIHSLGEKRFVSILEVDGQQFLLGGTASSLILLAKLEKERGPTEPVISDGSFREMLSDLSLRPQSGCMGLSGEYVEEPRI
jgi:flagellar biogenesis protein FliO